MLVEKIVYFEEPGKVNTEETLKLAIERAKARGIHKMVLASTRGDTARLAMDKLSGTDIRMVVVPHQYGVPEKQPFSLELIPLLEQKGHCVHFGTMLFHTDKLYDTQAPRVMATLLRTFSQGMKVCVEMTLMAVDGGRVAPGEQIVVVAGTGRGSDTAVVLTAASSWELANLHVQEIICKPLQTPQRSPTAPPMRPPQQTT